MKMRLHPYENGYGEWTFLRRSSGGGCTLRMSLRGCVVADIETVMEILGIEIPVKSSKLRHNPGR